MQVLPLSSRLTYCMPNMDHNLLQQPYALTPAQIDFYQTNRFIKLKGVLDVPTLDYYREKIGAEVDRLNTMHLPMERRDTYSKAFLQIFNLWREEAAIRQLVLSKRLGQIAADLMGVKNVRIYHDQALYKEPGGGFTPWHADQYYWPIDTDKTVTAWIPLQAIPLEMGPLEFSAKSHQLVFGRDLMIGDESEEKIQKNLRINDFEHVVEPYEAGEVSFHSGWVFHRAGPNRTDQMRAVMTVIYMDAEARLKQPENPNQINDWHTWCPGAVVGEVINTPLNPVVG